MIKNAQTILGNVHYDVHHASPLAKFDITISLNCNKWKYLVALFRSLSLFHVKQTHTHESCNALNTFFGIWGRKWRLTILYFIEQWNQMSPAFMRNYYLLALSTSCWSIFLHTLMPYIIIFFFILNVCLAYSMYNYMLCARAFSILITTYGVNVWADHPPRLPLVLRNVNASGIEVEYQKCVLSAYTFLRKTPYNDRRLP